MSKVALTPRQFQLLRYIASYRELHGYPPSIIEMTKEMGVSSTSGIRAHLDKLEAQGMITRSAKISRGLRLTIEGTRAAK